MAEADRLGGSRRKRRVIPPIRQHVIATNELDLFTPKPIQTSISSTTWMDIQPIGSIVEGNPIVFNVPGNEDEFLDPSFHIKIDAAVKNGTGTTLGPDSDVALTNCFAHSMFKRIDVKLHDKVISTSTDNYPYRAYIERLLNFTKESKETQLTAECFYKDTAGQFDEINVDRNIGYLQRRGIIAGSQAFTFFAKLSTDIANQPRLLLNNVDVLVTLHQSSNQFRFMFNSTTQVPKLELLNVQLFVRRIRVASPMAIAIAETLRLQPAHYPISRVIVKTFQISAGFR